MFKPGQMRISDYTCLLCGEKLGLKLADVAVGDNTGSCPLCGEPYMINITEKEMEEFIKLEKGAH